MRVLTKFGFLFGKPVSDSIPEKTEIYLLLVADNVAHVGVPVPGLDGQVGRLLLGPELELRTREVHDGQDLLPLHEDVGLDVGHVDLDRLPVRCRPEDLSEELVVGQPDQTGSARGQAADRLDGHADGGAVARGTEPLFGRRGTRSRGVGKVAFPLASPHVVLDVPSEGKNIIDLYLWKM